MDDVYSSGVDSSASEHSESSEDDSTDNSMRIRRRKASNRQLAPRLVVHAATSYEKDELVKVPVNDGDDKSYITLDSPYADIRLAVRINNYVDSTGKLTSTSYFDQPDHKNDQLSIQFSVKFKQTVDGNDLLFGNDFDEPIRDILPYGFSMGYKMFTWYVDPSVEGDPYCDTPYLYGRALSSINRITTGNDDQWPGFMTQDKLGALMSSEERMAFYRDQANRHSFEFVPDVQYSFDFFTPYLSLGDSFGIKLPGFSLDVGKYCGGQPLRYTLKSLSDDRVFLVVVFSLQQEA